MSVLQSTFAKNAALLILEMSKEPFTCTLGEAWRTPEQAALDAQKGTGIVHSLHCKRLAIDLELFIDGVWQTDTEAYRTFGEWWKSLNPANRWGGDFQHKKPDGNHFSMTDDGIHA